MHHLLMVTLLILRFLDRNEPAISLISPLSSSEQKQQKAAAGDSRCHSLHLDQNILGQPAHFDTAPGGLGLAKELGVDLVEGGKVVHVLEEDQALEDVGGGGVGSSEDGADVGEDLVLGISSIENRGRKLPLWLGGLSEVKC